MTDRELMQHALDALEEYVGVVVSVNDPNDWTLKVADAGEPARKAIKALRARLAQPEQPDYSKAGFGKSQNEEGCAECGKQSLDGWALYCVKCSEPVREWVGLTDEEREEAIGWSVEHIEATLKEKNYGSL